MKQKIYFSLNGPKSFDDFENNNSALQCKNCKCDLERYGRCTTGNCCQHFPPKSFEDGMTSFTCDFCACTVDVKQWIIDNLSRYSELVPDPLE